MRILVFLFIVFLAHILTECTILKRKYQKGYYISALTYKKKNARYDYDEQVRKNKENDFTVSPVSSFLKKINIANYKLSDNYFYAYTSNTVTSKRVYKYTDVKNFIIKSDRSLPLQKNDTTFQDRNKKNISSPKLLKRMIITDIIHLLVFIFFYTVLYNRIADIFISSPPVFLGCVFIPVSILSLGGIIFGIVNFIKMLRNPDSTVRQKIWAGILLFLSIALHPLMIFMYMYNLIIIL